MLHIRNVLVALALFSALHAVAGLRSGRGFQLAEGEEERAAALAARQDVQDRRYLLEELSLLAGGEKINLTDPVWDAFSYTPNRLYVGSDLLKTTSLVSAEECAGLCLDTEACWFWAWCPFNSSGCTSVAFGELETAITFGESACMLSSTSNDSAAYVVAAGSSVNWSSGKMRTPLLSGSDPFDDPIDSGDEASGIGSQRFSYSKNTLFLGAAVVGGTLNTTDSARQCSQRCAEVLLCELWAWCPSDAPTGCQIMAFGDFSSEGILGRVKPSTCLASLHASEKLRAAMVMVGDSVLWASGVLPGAETPSPSPSSPSPASPSPRPKSPTPVPPTSPSPVPPSPRSPVPVSPSPKPSSPSPASPRPSPSPVVSPNPEDPACKGVTCESPSPCLQDPGNCRDGTCWWYPQPVGTACGAGKECSSAGECVAASTLPAGALNGVCYWFPKPANTPCGSSGAVCDAKGTCSGEATPTPAAKSPSPSPTSPPAADPDCAGVSCTPPNACLLPPGKCIAGVCQWYPAAAGTACGAGKTCNALGACA
ncbi:hypothetical protein N2152v2_005286 [Parachlorella kessleri]